MHQDYIDMSREIVGKIPKGNKPSAKFSASKKRPTDFMYVTPNVISHVVEVTSMIFNVVSIVVIIYRILNMARLVFFNP
jgi:hypothetical protein